jgi:hypothetical protein
VTGGNVIVGGVDSGVPDQVDEEGCTLSQRIEQAGEGARNHGQFVSHLLTEWRGAGLITGRESGQIQNAAARSGAR